MSPCVDGTKAFLTKVVDEILKVHQEFLPDKFHDHFHIG